MGGPFPGQAVGEGSPGSRLRLFGGRPTGQAARPVAAAGASDIVVIRLVYCSHALQAQTADEKRDLPGGVRAALQALRSRSPTRMGPPGEKPG